MAHGPVVPPGAEVGYRVEWLYRDPPKLDAAAIQRALARALPETEVKELDPGNLSVAHNGHAVRFADGQGTALTAILNPKDRSISVQEFQTAVEQTWSWPRDEAKARIGRSRSRIVVMDLLSLGQPYQTRLRLVYKVARAVAATTQPEVAYWQPCDGYARTFRARSSRRAMPLSRARAWAGGRPAAGHCDICVRERRCDRR